MRRLLHRPFDEINSKDGKGEILTRLSVGVALTAIILVYFAVSESYVVRILGLALFTVIVISELVGAADLRYNRIYYADMILLCLLIVLIDVVTGKLAQIILWTVAFVLNVVLFVCYMTNAAGRSPGFMLTSVTCLSVALLIKSGDEFCKIDNGVYYRLFALIGCYASDISAYIFGKAFGKRKIFPKLSPKKTVFGCVSSMIATPLIMIGIGLLLRSLGLFDLELLPFVIYCLSLSFVSQFGDLSFSAYKRVCGVKDYGKILPGHGGMLDRFDGYLFVMCYTLIFFLFTGGFIV